MIFLRPWWLLALLVPIFFHLIKKNNTSSNPWAKIIDKKLLPYLTIKRRLPLTKDVFSKTALIFWSLAVLALSGPAWNKLPVPATQIRPNTALVLDLNNSLTPQEIQQLHIKLYDLLTLLKGDRVGIVLYGTNKGYTAMPLTPDTQLIENLIPSLLPSVLPENATNIQKGIQEAEKMLTQTGKNGRILILSDKESGKSKYPLAVIHPSYKSTEEIIKALEKTHVSPNEIGDWSNQTDEWYDRGIWLALLCLIPAALLFRKNVIFLMLIIFNLSTAEASLFKRSDQERYSLNQSGIEAYKNQDYQNAEHFFSKANHPYNQGNALAYQGKIQEAIQAYQEALKINPNDSDAQFNKEYLEKQLPPEEQQKQQNQKQNSSDNSEKQNDSSQEQSENQQDHSEDQTDSNQSEKENQKTQQDSTPQQTEQTSQENTEKEMGVQQEEAPFNQEDQQILNRINRDPARVLRYRINLQHQKRY